VLVDGRTVHAGAKKGSRIGSALVALGNQHVAVPVVLRQHLPKPTMLQRLF
jgi:hypothetical protein